MRRGAQVLGILGGLAWVAAWFVWEGGDDPVELGLFWAGAALVTLFLLELGTLLVKRGLLALRLFVACACRCCSGWSSRSSAPSAADDGVAWAPSRARWSRSLFAAAARPARAAVVPRSHPVAAARRACAHLPAEARTLAGMRPTGVGRKESVDGKDARTWRGLDQACRDDQPAHLPARPAGHRRRRRHERLRHRARPSGSPPRASRSTSSPGPRRRRSRRSSRPAPASWSATSTPARSRG